MKEGTLRIKLSNNQTLWVDNNRLGKYTQRPAGRPAGRLAVWPVFDAVAVVYVCIVLSQHFTR